MLPVRYLAVCALLGLAAATAAERPIASASNLDGLRIGVDTGSAEEAFARAHFPNATIVGFSASAADLVLALKSGKIDVVFGDEPPVVEIVSAEPSLHILPEPLFGFPLGVGFSKSSDVLRLAYNRLLTDLHATGEYDRLFARWHDPKDRHMPVIENDGAAGVLRMGTTIGTPPYMYLSDGEPVGIDAELALRFGAALHRRVDFQNMEFGGLIAAVASGKVDFISASIFITPERQQRISFSDPYTNLNAVAYVLRSRLPTTHTDYSAIAGAPLDAPPGTNQSLLSTLWRSVQKNLLQEHRYLLVLKGLWQTTLIALGSGICGTLIGALLCAGMVSPRRTLRLPAALSVYLLRGLPALVLLMLMFYVVFAAIPIPAAVVAIIAFGLHFGGYCAEIFRTSIIAIDAGQQEAGLSLGFSSRITFFRIVLPQALPRILPIYKGEFISLLKMTSVVGYIAVMDLTKAGDLIRSRTFEAFFPIVLVAALYFSLAWLLLKPLIAFERRADPLRRRKKK